MKTDMIVKDFVNVCREWLRSKAELLSPCADASPQDAPRQEARPDHDPVPAPYDWLLVAQYGAGEVDADPAYIVTACQEMARWLFQPPGAGHYSIPEWWYDTEIGRLWSAAYVRASGNQLISISEAADMLGRSMQAVDGYIYRGRLQAYVDPREPNPQRRRRVARADVERLARDRGERSALTK
jgi:hypothetical protein